MSTLYFVAGVSGCITGFSYGHIDSRYVLPIGQMVTIDVTNCKLEIHFE